MSQSADCPACGFKLLLPADVEPGPLTCPQCNGAIAFPGMERKAGDEETRRARLHILRRGLNYLIGITGIAIGFVYGLGWFSPRFGGPDHWQIGVLLWLAALFAILDFLVVLALSLWIVPQVAASLEDSESTTRKRPLALQILVGIFVVSGTGVAVVAFFFATCAGLIRTLSL